MKDLMRLGNAGRFMPSIFHDDFFDAGNSLPAANVTETTDAYKVELAVPGLSKDNILTILGNAEERKEDKNDENKLIRHEFRSSSFNRAFNFPEHVEAENIVAEHKDSLLILSIPKMDATKKEVKNRY